MIPNRSAQTVQDDKPRQQRRFLRGIPDIWLALALILLVLAVVIGVGLHRDRRQVEASERERLLARTKVVQQVLNEELSSLYNVLGNLSADWTRNKSDKNFNNRLKALEQGMPGVRTLLLLDRQGEARASNRPELLGKNFSHRDYFQNIRQHPDPDMLYVTPPYTTVLGVYSVNLCRMIHGLRGEFEGLILATLDPKFFAPLLEAILSTPDMRAGIVHGGGIMFLLRPEHVRLDGKDLASPESFFTQHQRSGREVSVYSGTTVISGDARLVALRTIRPQGLLLDQPLVVSTSRDLDAIYADWRSSANWQAGLYLLVALASCAGVRAYERRRRQFERQEALAAQALQDSERFMRTVTDNIPGMVGYWDSDLRCHFANSAYLEWFGRTREQMLGARIQDVLGEELFRKNEPWFRAVFAGQTQHVERTLAKADGSTGYVLAHFIPDKDGERVRGFFVLAADVTELKEAQLLLETRVAERTEELRQTVEALEAAKAQAESASRMKSDFLANLSHELRTPLNPILALTDLVLDTELTQEQRDYLQDVSDSARKLLNLFNRLIELMELESCEPVPGVVSLASLREMAVQSIATAAGAKGLSLEGTVAAGLPQAVWLDLRLLRMALLELAENAVRFTNEGTVSITLTAMTGAAGGQELCIEVRDTGIGIPAERLEAINTGLTQADAPLTKRFAGLGIGMAKARKAVALLGGRLEVESAPGQGTAFRINLPLVAVEMSGDMPEPLHP